jgi:hypothetical protein
LPSQRSLERRRLLRRKINFTQCCLNHLHHELTLSFGNPYGPLGEASSDRLPCEVGAPFTFLRFKISESSDRLAGYIDPDVLRGSIGVADKGCYFPGVEDAIKITTGSLGCVGELVTGSLDL